MGSFIKQAMSILLPPPKRKRRYVAYCSRGGYLIGRIHDEWLFSSYVNGATLFTSEEEIMRAVEGYPEIIICKSVLWFE